MPKPVFENGVFTYESSITPSSVMIVAFSVTLDLNHPTIRQLIFKALRNKTKQTVLGGGALKVEVS